jgi:hypothetical protein
MKPLKPSTLLPWEMNRMSYSDHCKIEREVALILKNYAFARKHGEISLM